MQLLISTTSMTPIYEQIVDQIMEVCELFCS